MSTNARHDATGPMTASDAANTANAAAALAELFAMVESDPTAFDFFALMRRIDCLRREQPRTGEAQRPRQEAVRLGQAPELDFAPAPLHGLQRREGQAAPRLLVRFFGLLGPMGPMPLHFTEVVRERQRNDGDPTLAHFLDLFHHRLLSLFYRAWAQAQPVVHLDRPGQDRFRAWVGALAGTPAGSGALPPEALAYQGGWMTARSRHPEMLCKVIEQFFGVPARVEEHVGQWLPIDRHDRTRLSFARNRAERAATPPAALGRSANAGARVWDRQYRFRLHLGPLTHAQLLAFLPGGEAWPRLLHWVRLLAGRELQWELELEIATVQQPRPELGRTPGVSPRLGLTSRLGRAGEGRRVRATDIDLGLDLGLEEAAADAPPESERAASRPRGDTPTTPATAGALAAGRSLRLRPQSSFLAHRAAATAAVRARQGAGAFHNA